MVGGGKVDQEREEGRETRGRGGVFGFEGHASGGAEGPKRLHTPALALVEVVSGDRLRLGRVEIRGLDEVVGEGFLGDLFCVPTTGAHLEFGLG